MAKKKTNRKKAKSQGGSAMQWLILVLILAVIAVAAFIAYQYSNKENPVKDSVNDSVLFGKTWVSHSDGAMLTVDELGNYTLDFPSVETTEPWKGQITLQGDNIIISLENHRNLCNEGSGTFSYSIVGKELEIKVLKDNCKIRRERLSGKWFLL
ncbi:MAG: hypothetical protein KKA81_08140 [Bacteroidetes bacterium]|nr:hypothetical protein [Bacteroidota bacterium]